MAQRCYLKTADIDGKNLSAKTQCLGRLNHTIEKANIKFAMVVELNPYGAHHGIVVRT
jgi:hypothetical protein